MQYASVLAYSLNEILIDGYSQPININGLYLDDGSGIVEWTGTRDELLDLLSSEFFFSVTKAEILGGVPNSIIVSTSQATPSTISGMVLVVERGLELQVDNSIKNITGRTINLFGTISYHPDNTSATSVLNMCVQRSTDNGCLLYTSPSPRDRQRSRMPSSA